ncbi:MAG TPA: sigma-70 family RNA polymerase sigma factor, partial [Vicinamibacteria bacterium]|nr:sigma-70 family RNA polymerase sigma factor [Vicinamibacteria bacterium]
MPPSAGSDDRTLVERCQRGDLEAFEPLVEKYRQRVWRLAYNVLRDREEAWDVAQDAFIRAYQALPGFRGQSAFYTWLFRITMNVATDRARQRGARGRAFGTERVPEEDWERVRTEAGETADARAARGEERTRLTRALEDLSEAHRAIVVLSDIEGLSYREIADVLQIPMGTVMSRLHHARRRLREALGPMLALVVVLLAALAPASAAAQGPSPPAVQVVRFGARVLLAGDSPPPAGVPVTPTGPDERLAAFLPKLRQLFRYREYTSLERYRAQVPIGSTQRWPVPGDRVLELTPDSVDRAVRLRLRL